ncbi:MAG: hypothetical protein MJZ41_06440 [Bacteroidaceae bacterium]|nr:hypothetical protein [Bacteroidaceae bacterium]
MAVRQYSNAQKLASVVSYWARPFAAEIAASSLCKLDVVKAIENGIIRTGLVSESYDITSDIRPLINPVFDALSIPLLEQYFAQVPDEALPQLANNLVSEMQAIGQYSIFNGNITFSKSEIDELAALIKKNLPIKKVEHYEVVT